ncbi:uncharacterized protein [Diabrotica undecimpunctata]|uniref:uncharacterized protein n=1 Tax=Diabrotica undecimpunctata TaxID=50387 RepID=UPI003B63ED38
MTFRHHIQEVCPKAEKTTSTLHKIMPNNRRRRVTQKISYPTINQSIMFILLYGALVWHEILNKAKYKDMLPRTQTKPLIQGCRAYRTVSIIALQVVAGAVPVHIFANESIRVHQRGNRALGSEKQKRKRSLEIWQD